MPIPTRRLFLSSALAVPLFAAAPLQRGQPKKAHPHDPMLEHFGEEAARIKREVERGQHGPTQARALEHLYRVQAIHFIAKGYNDDFTTALRQKVASVGREALASETLNAAAAAGQHTVSQADLETAITQLADVGLAGWWRLRADFWKEHGPKLDHGPRVVNVQWYGYNACPTIAYLADLDMNLAVTVCSVMAWSGPFGEVVCALWGLEVGLEQLFVQHNPWC